MYLAPEIWMRKTYGFEVAWRSSNPNPNPNPNPSPNPNPNPNPNPHQVDWWSLGCVLYEMVCGLPPFWGDTIKDVYKKVIHSTPKFPAISPECQACMETRTRTRTPNPNPEPEPEPYPPPSARRPPGH